MFICVNDKMQTGYCYERTEPEGQNFAPEFRPELTPPQMLELGVFEGKYLNDCHAEFPLTWFFNAKTAPQSNAEINCFKLKSRLSLQEWQRRGWILGPDVRGWFQWYCRYYSGRRIPELDKIQIKRWRAFARHAAQIRLNCPTFDYDCRPRQRQALLQWAYNPFI